MSRAVKERDMRDHMRGDPPPAAYLRGSRRAVLLSQAGDLDRPAGTATRGPRAPQPGVPEPDEADQLPIRQIAAPADLWVVGTHGGAGEATVASLDPSWAAAGHGWACDHHGGSTRAVVVARTHVRGLMTAKAAAKQWASYLVPGVELLGLVLVADAPGRLPKPLRDLARLVSGGYPRTWRLPWQESWRLGEPPDPLTSGRETTALVRDLHALTTVGAPNRPTSGKDHHDGAA